MLGKLHAAMVEIATRKDALHALRPEGLLLPEGWLETEAGRSYERAQAAVEDLLASYAADPELRQHMIPWMVDIGGREPIETSMSASERELHRAVKADFGVLPRRVRDWLEDNDFEVTDSGGGSTGWHLGVPCTDAQAGRLCRLAHVEFRSFLDIGMLTVQLKFWGWRFAGLDTPEEVERFLREKVPS